MKFAMRFVFGSMFATVLTVPVSAHSSIAERQRQAALTPGSRLFAGAVPYNGGGFGGLTDRELGRAIARGFGMMGDSGMGMMRDRSGPHTAPAPPPETEPNLPTAKKKRIYDDYIRFCRKIRDDLQKLPQNRKEMFLWKWNRELLPFLALKYHRSQPEIQWIVNHGDEIEVKDSGIQTALNKEKPISSKEVRQREIFKDWTSRRDKALQRSLREKSQSRRAISMKLEDQRTVKDLTEKYHITPEELHRIKAMGDTKNW